MCYGPDAGDPRLRRNVATWLTEFYQPTEAIHVDRICITGGASQNLACLLQSFTDPVYTRNVWIVAPAYMLSFRIFEDAGFHKKLRAVPEDDDGIDIDFLRREIRKSEDAARSEGNNAPVSSALADHCDRLTSCVAPEASTTLRQILQTHHLRCTHLLESKLQDDELEKKRGARPLSQRVRRARGDR